MSPQGHDSGQSLWPFCQSVSKHLVNLAIVAVIEARWHPRHNPSTAVIEHKHASVIGKGEALYLALLGHVVKRALERNGRMCCVLPNRHAIDVIWLIKVGIPVVCSQVKRAIEAGNSLYPLRTGMELHLAEVFARFKVIPIEIAARCGPRAHPHATGV